jgi:hypothetical protein
LQVEVNLEHITLKLRPRSGWEALDLGLRLAVSHARSVWGVWFAVTLPVTLVVWAACWTRPWAALLLLWWLKPLADRFVLHVLAQVVFGESPRLAGTLGAWRQVLRHGTWSILLWRRWDAARSFHQPVAQLEQQSGKAAMQRRSVLGRNAWGQAVWLSITCRMFSVVLFLSGDAMLWIMLPEGIEPDNGSGGIWNGLANWSWDDNLMSYLALSLIEPFYVAAGFALYLNRRVQLEGWDVELALRMMDARVRRIKGVRGALGAALLALACMLMPLAHDDGLAFAQEQQVQTRQLQTAADPAKVIKEVLAQADFGSTKENSSWRMIPEAQQEKSSWNLGWLTRWFDLVAQGGQVLGWVALAIALIAVLRFVLVAWGRHVAPVAAGWRAPEVLFGLAIAPKSLPQDVAGTARTLAHAGDVRGALSLLYRGVLSQLVHRYQVRLSDGDTEGDTQQRAATVLRGEASAVFAKLVQAWQLTAYAARPIAADDAVQLCSDWAAQFGLHAGSAPGEQASTGGSAS